MPDGFGQRHVDHFVVAHAYHDVALALHDGLDGSDACARCQDAVVGRRRAAALQVAEDGHSYVELRELFPYAVGVVEGAALGAFRDDDDTGALRLADAVFHESCELVGARHVLGHDGCFGTAGDG